jgi:hypothetical protein
MKKLLTLALALTLTLVFAACGGGEEDEPTPVVIPPVTDAPPPPPPPPEPQPPEPPVENGEPDAPSTPFINVDETMYITSSQVNVRAGYSTDTEVLGVLRYGDAVRVTGINADGSVEFHRVEYNGAVAYVHRDWLSDTEPPELVEEPGGDDGEPASEPGSDDPGIPDPNDNEPDDGPSDLAED